MSNILLSLTTVLYAQTDISWWEEKHNFDGTRFWSSYLTMSPKYLGPNALPVPEFHGSEIPNQKEISIGTEVHHSTGDKTANLHCFLNYPLFNEKASIYVEYRPIEIYRTDTITRDLRASRQFNPEGHSSGDLYVSTHIQLLKDHEKWPDFSIGIGLKTASGTGLKGARHTDTPGYWFELGLGKSILTGLNKLRSIELYSRIGFYAYQTYLENHRQNDAFLYGAGIDLEIGKLRICNQLTGFHGYLDNGDSPLVYRMILKPSTARRVSGYILLQQGLKDFQYTSARLALVINLSSKLSAEDAL
jgi:hypothetical protein